MLFACYTFHGQNVCPSRINVSTYVPFQIAAGVGHLHALSKLVSESATSWLSAASIQVWHYHYCEKFLPLKWNRWTAVLDDSTSSIFMGLNILFIPVGGKFTRCHKFVHHIYTVNFVEVKCTFCVLPYSRDVHSHGLLKYHYRRLQNTDFTDKNETQELIIHNVFESLQ